MITCQSLGLPKDATYFLYLVLGNMEFRIGTGHGISECFYGANEDPTKPGQGSGQGFGSGPVLWNSNGNANLETYAALCPGAVFIHPGPDRSADMHMHSVCFVDDTTQLTNDLGIQRYNETAPTLHPEAPADIVVECTNSNAQKYSQILRTSGGQLAPDKCNVYLLKPKWVGGTRVFEQASTMPGKIAVS